MKKKNVKKLKPKIINMLRNMAVKIEKFQQQLKEFFTLTSEQKELKEKIDSGEIVIIPIGFRCHTKMKFREKIGLGQESLIFDSGFFPPASVVSIFKEPKINLKYGDQSQTVCIKYENHNDSEFGKGIKFQKSSYDKINSIATCKEIENINRYLDSTFGYYTLDTKHNFVLAHYNWHQLANPEESKGITDPKINLENITDILNRRIKRMIEKCNKAKHIFFIHLEDQGYNYMMIDNEKFDLGDFQNVLSTVDNMFDAKIHIVDVCKVNNAKEILNMI